MESHRLQQAIIEDSLPIRYRLTGPFDINDEDIDTVPSSNAQPRRRSTKRVEIADFMALPWFGWLFVSTFQLTCFSVSRCVALKALAAMYDSPQSYTISFKFAALSLGFMEDFICTIYLVCALWLFDTCKLAIIERWNFPNHESLARFVKNVATFTVSWVLFFIATAPFALDMLLAINWNLRFSMELVATLIREKENIKRAPITTEAYLRAYTALALLLSAATIFALIRTFASWADLACWNPSHLITTRSKTQERHAPGKVFKRAKYNKLPLEEGQDVAEHGSIPKLSSVNARRPYRYFILNHAIQVTVVLVGLVVIPAAIVAVRYAFSPVVAFVALNATVNELLDHALQPSAAGAMFTNVDGKQPWMSKFIHPTETYELFGNDSLYRRTTGFRGDLAFDVNVSNDNPPNVILVGIESFRFQDSRYMVGKDDPSYLFKGTNLTITPNFDRWAKRGVALRNFWSSYPTSRSVESIQFGQVPYDSMSTTGLTGGRNETKLAGLPQLFSAKGYETFFSTGSSITYDNWDKFLPTHGFDTVWERKTMVRLAEMHHNISREDWKGPAKRGFRWGVHDDLSFDILGDLLVNKTNRQKERVARGEPKKPLFITHYTITSHEPFAELPTWYVKSEKPDFSDLYNGENRAKKIQSYYEARYFTDVQLGKFLDRMEAQGILNDSIVVVMGDHGTAPEVESVRSREEAVTRVPGVIIAEGRLGKAAGTMIEDAAEQYDILNTLADITGVPKEGFIQDGVGRSLKRKVAFGERVVYSNLPGYRMSIVRGHLRLRYDNIIDTMWMHNTENDHEMAEDLFPTLSYKQQAEWNVMRENGRHIAAYYKKRWDDNCLLATSCN
ncbi:unnamed protein product [Peronospora belbahrii]|uniref:Sulfatase N-terminal domain-containing protein n=1 Tax=Peronospora belbahrii TaxID=622444 RepID=A0ABN8CMD2_9STRA|nr:unnamed protein product [Peronospora belbahrii]